MHRVQKNFPRFWPIFFACFATKHTLMPVCVSTMGIKVHFAAKYAKKFTKLWKVFQKKLFALLPEI
jgi:hypothetical protein